MQFDNSGHVVIALERMERGLGTSCSDSSSQEILTRLSVFIIVRLFAFQLSSVHTSGGGRDLRQFIIPFPLAVLSLLIHSKLDRKRKVDRRKTNDPFLPSPLPSSIRLCFCLRFHGSH